MAKANEEKVRQILDLAKGLASQRTDEGLDKAAEILLHTINEGCNSSEILVTAASYLLQGPRGPELETKKKAISLVDKAVSLASGNIHILEAAIDCYELVLNDFPERLNDIIRLCLKVLDINPEHVNCMIILANHRDNPDVALSLDDTIRMLEWAHDVDPTNKMVYYTLFKLYIEAGIYEKAKKIYKNIIDNTRHNSKEAKNVRQQMHSLKDKSQYKRYRKYSRN